MARLLILGAGISGQTAALHAKKRVGSRHEIIVVSPNSKWNWIPSNIWVGIGKMKPEDVTFELKPVYDKMKIPLIQGKAVAIYPEGDNNHKRAFVKVLRTDKENLDKEEIVEYDYLLNATGPKLKFEATEGLGPEKNTHSVCTFSHAQKTSEHLDELIECMKRGEEKTLLIGTGHGSCTCQGAAFEYIFNVEHELRRRKVRDKARIIWISNEQELGDFGIGGMHIRKGGYVTHSRVFTESLFAERNVEWITRAHVTKAEKNEVFYETIEGEKKSVKHDFAMLLPPFSGVGMKAFNYKNDDITDSLFAKNGFMKVDADYTKKDYEEWTPEDWPKTYQNPVYKNIYAVGIAFAPPHAISQPVTSVNGTPISPTPPRTGMPSGVMAREVVFSIIDIMDGKSDKPTREASMANMGAACIASAGANPINGTAVSMTMYPIIPDFKKFPETGRDLNYTTGEIGLAGHWVKHLLHFAFMYKAKAKPFWRIVPE